MEMIERVPMDSGDIADLKDCLDAVKADPTHEYVFYMEVEFEDGVFVDIEAHYEGGESLVTVEEPGEVEGCCCLIDDIKNLKDGEYFDVGSDHVVRFYKVEGR